MSPRLPVAILGAGLTGLSAALCLREKGIRCRVFEKADRPGGHAITVEENGYRFDRTGHLLHLRDASIRDLAHRVTEGGLLEIERQSRVFSHGIYTRYPYQANTHGLPAQVAYECLLGFVRAQMQRPASPPTTFEEFCLAHFGEGISKHFMVPYNTKLWGVPPSEITADWCNRFVPLPKLEDVIAGAVGLSDPGLGYNARFSYPRLGIGALAEGLARAVGEIELSRAPSAIDTASRTLRIGDEVVPYEVLISTAPLPRLISLVTDAPEPVKQASSRLRCTHLHYLDLALNGPCLQPFHWIYVPEPQIPFYRVGAYSSFSPAMAPPNKASLYVELADRSPPDLGRILPEIADHLVRMRLVDSHHAIRFARARTIPFAYVVFDKHYYPALDAIGPFLASRRIASVGRYGAWNYSSMEDALLFGRDAANRAEAWLSEPDSLARGDSDLR